MSNTPKVFDLLIIYSHHQAMSASCLASDINSPFAGSKQQAYNPVYSYFLQQAGAKKLSCALTTSANIIGSGLCHYYWTYENKKWHKHDQLCTTRQVFDKFSPYNQDMRQKRHLFFTNSYLKPFNQPRLQTLFLDKKRTYQTWPQYHLPTVTLESQTWSAWQKAQKELKHIVRIHPHPEDFSSLFILKDRFGAGGSKIFKLQANSASTLKQIFKKHPDTRFIVQPFLKFDRGFIYQNQKVMADIRLVFFNHRIVQSYIRLAPPGSFKCNEHQGGHLIYLPSQQLPDSVITMAKKISSTFTAQPALYALDFLMSNHGHVYFLEGNDSPGLDWNLALPANEIQAKKLIRLLVNYFTQQKEQYSSGTKYLPPPTATYLLS